MLNLNFLEKSLRLASPPHFVYDFSRKAILLSGCEILDNVSIVIICFPVYYVINFETNDKKLNILRTERAFKIK